MVSFALGAMAKISVFDETYVHRAENLMAEKRIILFCDVERPLKSALITRLNRWVSNNLVKATATQNFDGERVGVVNKSFGHFYEIHLAGQRLKKRNTPMMKSCACAALAAATISASLAPMRPSAILPRMLPRKSWA